MVVTLLELTLEVVEGELCLNFFWNFCLRASDHLNYNAYMHVCNK